MKIKCLKCIGAKCWTIIVIFAAKQIGFLLHAKRYDTNATRKKKKFLISEIFFYLVIDSKISVLFRSLISTFIEKVKMTIFVRNYMRNIFCLNNFSVTKIVYEYKLKTQKFSQKIWQNLLLFVELIGLKWFLRKIHWTKVVRFSILHNFGVL